MASAPPVIQTAIPAGPSAKPAAASSSSTPEALAAQVLAKYSSARAEAGERHWYTSNAQDQAIAALERLEPVLKAWSTDKLRWAKAGRRDDGTAYNLQRWAGEAADYVPAMAYFVDMKSEGSQLAALAKATAATVKDTVAAVEKTASVAVGVLPYLPWLLGAAALGVGFLYLRPFLPKLPTP